MSEPAYGSSGRGGEGAEEASGSRDVTVLVVATPGRRTGPPRSTCVRYLATPDGFLVWGTASGALRDPSRFEDLRAAPITEVQVRARRPTVQPHESTGRERDTMWRQVILAATPEVATYARNTGRNHPVAVLRPIDGAGPPTSTNGGVTLTG